MDIIQTINRNRSRLVHDIYTLKIYLSIFKDEDNDQKLLYLEKIYNKIDSRINAFQKSNIDQDYNLLENDYYTITSLIDEIKISILPKQNLAGAIFLDNMKNNELNIFMKKYFEILATYDNIKLASIDIFQNHSIDVMKFNQATIDFINSVDIPNKKLIPLDFLKSCQNEKQLNHSTWLLLLRSLRTTYKYLNNIENETLNILKNELVLYNVYYFIVVMGA